MIKGIGVDTVAISRVEEILAKSGEGDAFFVHGFTAREREEAGKRGDKAGYYAARFAVKEAVYKAIAPCLPEDAALDLRKIESVHDPKGAPVLSVTGYLEGFLDLAGIRKIHLSVTTEADLATAFAVAEGTAQRS